MKNKYNKAFKLLKELHRTNPTVDEVLRYLSTQKTIKKVYA